MNYTQLYPEFFGLKEPPKPEPETEAKQALVSVSRALLIVNEGNSIDELAILPTIGKGAAKVILSDRPDSGYSALSELPAKIFRPPYNCDVAEIEAYTGE